MRSELADKGDINDRLYREMIDECRKEEELNREHLSIKCQLQDAEHEVDTFEDQIENMKKESINL